MSNSLFNWHRSIGEPFGRNLNLSELADDVGDYLIEKGISITDYPVADIYREIREDIEKCQ